MDSMLYREIEEQTIRNFNLRCIDGTLHGCGKCVGYCTFAEHPGFLTSKMQAEHKCLEKGCYYHYPKPARQNKSSKTTAHIQEQVLLAAQTATIALEGMRVIRASLDSDTSAVIHYAAIAEYDIHPFEEEIAAKTGYSVHLKKIICDFDIAVALVMQ